LYDRKEESEALESQLKLMSTHSVYDILSRMNELSANAKLAAMQPGRKDFVFESDQLNDPPTSSYFGCYIIASIFLMGLLFSVSSLLLIYIAIPRTSTSR
jgi:hypothetical protein